MQFGGLKKYKWVWVYNVVSGHLRIKEKSYFLSGVRFALKLIWNESPRPCSTTADYKMNF